MKIAFTPTAWEQYGYWAQTDRQIVKRIHALIKDIQRSPFDGIGKPEPLKHQYTGLWSRRIDDEHRLVYRVLDDELMILQCRFHY